MPGKIFVNYRRGDDPGFTQALYQRLEDEFEAGNLFMDVEGHIKPGDDFVEVLRSQVEQCDVLLVVIGPRWASLLLERQGDPDDFVAIEIRAALESGKRVVPVLVGGGEVPRPDILPDEIRSLARRNAVGLRPERFKSDCQGLVAALQELLATIEAEREARTEADRLAAEKARRMREDEEAARAAAAEQRAREQAVAGLSQEEIKKAEELANWQFVESRNDIAELRDHLARFPGGVTARYAMSQLEELVWRKIGDNAQIDDLQDFLDEFPNGAHAQEAQARVETLVASKELAEARQQREQEEEIAWNVVKSTDDLETISGFRARYPDGIFAQAAREQEEAILAKQRALSGQLSESELKAKNEYNNQYNEKYVKGSQKFMRWRVGLQFAALVLIGLVSVVAHLLTRA